MLVLAFTLTTEELGANLADVFGIKADDAAAWWPVVGGWIADALAYGGGFISIEDAKQSVQDRDFQLWGIAAEGVPVAACLTQICIWPQGKALTVIAVGGNRMDDWIAELDDVMQSFARSKGCKVVSCHGRKGWKKSLEPLGFSQSVVTYMKEVAA